MTSAETLTATLGYIDSWLRYQAWKGQLPGVQAAIFFDGEVQLSMACGFADVSEDSVLTPNHLFRVASHSKTFTATAILQLVEQGMLRLDDTVGSLLPALATGGSPLTGVTVRELLEHSGGVIRDGLDGDYWQYGRPFPEETELLAMVLEGGYKAEANEKFNYSNIGYSLLGLIIAAVSGLSYHEYVMSHIVEPLGLLNTGPEWDESRAAEYASGYSGRLTSVERRALPHVDTRAMAAATGFYSTAADLVRFAAAHFDGDERLLSEASKRVQQREHWRTDPAESAAAGYGLGMIVEKIANRQLIGHSGGYPGHITRTIFDPVDRFAVSVLANAIDAPASALAVGVLKLLDAALAGAAAESGSNDSGDAAVDRTVDPSRFIGRYANLWEVVDIVQLGNRLVALNPASADPLVGLDDLAVISDDTLLISRGSGFGSIGELMHFEFTADGAVARVRGGGGMTLLPFDLTAADIWLPPFA